MNPLHLELLARDRVAEFRRQASNSVIGAHASTPKAPQPRMSRRGPLYSVARLTVLVRAALA